MDQKKYEQTQRPKPRKRRIRRIKPLRAAGTTAKKKNQGQVKINERMLELENENKELKRMVGELQRQIRKLAPRNSK